MTDSRYGILFEPIQIGPVVAPNRFFAVPHATGHGWTQPRGAIALRAMKAEGGWGTVAVQISEIAADSDFANHPMERIWDDSDLPRHAAQVEAIKRHGSLAAIELGHGGMRARNLTTGLPVIGPSCLPVLRPEVQVHAMSLDLAGIAAFRASHKAAVRRAIRAGYDIVYVYAAHDLSILSHFLSSATNRRTDDYGGSFENRLRLLKQVLEDALEAADGKTAVALRFSVAEPGKTNGLAHDGEGRDTVEALAELPDLWDVNLSGWSNDSATARFSGEGFQLHYTDFVKSVTSKPVVGVGRFTSPDFMVSLIANGRLDLIGAARPSIADPFLPAKIRENKVEDIRECIGCNVCVSMDSYGLPIRCTQNPTISEEWRSGWHPEAPASTRRRKSHLIVGAGPAGLECALTLMRAGQQVTVADSAPEAGGRVTSEARLPGLSTWLRVRDYRVYQLSQKANAELYLSSRMSAGDISEFGADTTIIAAGARWRRDGVGSTNFDPLNLGGVEVLTPDDIMDGAATDRPPMKFVVYDDDHFYMGSVIAEQLRNDGHDVVYATPLPSIATWTENTLEQPRIIERFAELGVAMRPNLKLEDNCVFRDTLSERRVELEADAIAFVGARLPVEDLKVELSSMGGLGDIRYAGDCLLPGTIQAAVLSGHRIAREILLSDGDPAIPKREQLFVATE